MNTDSRVDVPVVIVGCGPVGLMTSILLSREGVAHLLVEKRDAVSTLPRARGITVRTVELLAQIGLGPVVESISLPPHWTRGFTYTETLAGALVGKMASDTMQPGVNALISPCDYKVAAQDRIDPMLYDCARGFSHADIRFGTEVVGYREDGGAAVVTLRHDGSTADTRCHYVVAADGGKSGLRQIAGIGERGRTNLRSFVNTHFRADLRRYTEGREGALIWTLAPGVEGVFQMLDGEQHWAVQIQYDPEADLEPWTQERVVTRLRSMIGDPSAAEIDFEILKIYTYTISAMISERLREGRLLLVGDAAHQIPPYGGFGMNTGVQTAHNLAWKLAAVLRGEASETLFDTFDTERREVAARVCEFGRTNAGYIEQLMAAVRGASDASERRKIIESTRQYGNWMGLDLSVHYKGDGAFVPDDVPAPATKNPVVDYVPHAKPGYRAPHLWVQRGGERVSTVMLFDRTFVLLAGAEGAAWVEAARDIASDGRPRLEAYRVADDGDLIPESDFAALYGITRSGAVLVRPDGHVAYRAQALLDDPCSALESALDRILRRLVSVGSQ